MITDAAQILSRNGIRPSPQRVAVFKAVFGRKGHPSVDTVFTQLRKAMPTLSRTTVYAAMALFAEKKLIGEVHIDEGEVRYDGFTHFHAHFQCRKCGQLFDIELDGSHEHAFAKMPKGFVADDEALIYRGLCPHCSVQKGNEK